MEQSKFVTSSMSAIEPVSSLQLWGSCSSTYYRKSIALHKQMAYGVNFTKLYPSASVMPLRPMVHKNATGTTATLSVKFPPGNGTTNLAILLEFLQRCSNRIPGHYSLLMLQIPLHSILQVAMWLAGPTKWMIA